jgi:hypothetical protein
MSAIINQQSDNNYVGTLKSVASIANGVFVTPNWTNGTAAAVADDTAGDAAGLMMVYNVNDKIDQELVADSAFTVASGKYLRLKAFQVGDIFTTDQFKGTYGSIAADSVFAVGDGGTIEAVAARTPKFTVKVIEKTTLYGANALKCIVVSA